MAGSQEYARTGQACRHSEARRGKVRLRGQAEASPCQTGRQAKASQGHASTAVVEARPGRQPGGLVGGVAKYGNSLRKSKEADNRREQAGRQAGRCEVRRCQAG
jgi:hypothetical protein